MIYTLDLEKNASSALVRSKSSSLSEKVLPSFWADKIRLELEFVEPASWVGDTGAVVKARVGLLPNTYLVDATTAVWDGKRYVIDLDFNNSSFNSAITDKLELTGFFELQLEYNGRSRTLLQQSAKFRNSFLSAGVVTLTLPAEPTLPEAEVKSPPNAPSLPAVDRSPLKPSLVELGTRPSKPIAIGSGNLSILPLKPSVPQTSIIILRPNPPVFPQAIFGGLPDGVNNLEVGFYVPPPEEITEVRAVVVRKPVLGEVFAFEVVEANEHKDFHKYIYLNIDGALTNRQPGQVHTPDTEPFKFSKIDSYGNPEYTRPLSFNILHLDESRDITTAKPYEKIVVKQAYTNNNPNAPYISTIDNKLICQTAEQALWYNPAGYDTMTYRYSNGTSRVVYMPKNQPSNIARLDWKLKKIVVSIAYDYDTYDGSQYALDCVSFSAYVNDIYPAPDQLKKLGYKHYGGKKLSYYEGLMQTIETWDNRAWSRPDYNQAVFTISPAYSGLTAPKPDAPVEIDAEELLPPSSAPSLVSSLELDFDIYRYSPVIHIDSTKELPSSVPLPRLKNFALTNYEILPHEAGERTSLISDFNKQVYDFSSTKNAYKIPQNIFGEKFREEGGEALIFVVLKALEFIPENPARNYAPHLFVNLDGQNRSSSIRQRFTCHAPWSDGRYYFDAGRVVPSVQSRVNTAPLDTEETYTILVLKSSIRDGSSQIRVNGVLEGETFYPETMLDYKEFVLGGWGTENYGQSMNLGEILMFRNGLSQNMIEKVEGYLSHKWGIILDSSHSYYNSKPSNFGEFRELDPYPDSPLVEVEAYPLAPQNISTGFGCEKPSLVEAEYYPNAPTQVIADDIPLLRFIKPDNTEISTLVAPLVLNINIIDTEEFLKQELIDLEVQNIQSQPEPVTYNLVNTYSDISPQIEIEEGVVKSFSLGAVEDKPYLAQDEEITYNLELQVTDQQGNTNALPIQAKVKGVSRKATGIYSLENISDGAVFDFNNNKLEPTAGVHKLEYKGYRYITDEGVQQAFNYIWIQSLKKSVIWKVYSERGADMADRLLLPSDHKVHTFSIRVVSPDKTGAKLILSFHDGMNENYCMTGGAGDALIKRKYEITAGFELDKPPAYFYYWYPQDGAGYSSQYIFNIPFRLTCTQIDEIIQDVEKVYHFEYENFDSLNTIARDENYQPYYIEKDLHKIYTTKDYVNNCHELLNLPSPKHDPREIETLANDYTKGFNLRFGVSETPQYRTRSPFVDDILRVYIDTWGLAPPSAVKADLGAKVWATPSLVEPKVLIPEFPSEQNLSVDGKHFGRWSTRHKDNQGNYYLAWLDKYNETLRYAESGLAPDRYARSSMGFPNVDGSTNNFWYELGHGEQDTWVWAFDINSQKANEGRIGHTFVHYSKLNNISVQDCPHDIIQQPYKYPFGWHLVGADGKPAESGVLDPTTIARLLNKREKIITFPSGRKQITQFGGYVQSSGKVIFRIHKASLDTNTYGVTFDPQNYYQFICEPNHLGDIKLQTLQWFSRIDYRIGRSIVSKSFKDLPAFAMPFRGKYGISNYTRTYNPDNFWLSYEYARMAGEGQIDALKDITQNGIDLDRLTINELTAYTDFNSLEESAYFFHTNGKDKFTNEELHKGSGYIPSIFYEDFSQYEDIENLEIRTKQNLWLSKNLTYENKLGRACVTSIEFLPSDDSLGVHPKWGRSFKKYFKHYFANGFDPLTERLDYIPDLPSSINLFTDSTDSRVISGVDVGNLPAKPSSLNAFSILTTKDLSIDYNTPFNSLFTANLSGKYFVVPYDMDLDYTESYNPYNRQVIGARWSQYTQYKYRKQTLKAGQIYFMQKVVPSPSQSSFSYMFEPFYFQLQKMPDNGEVGVDGTTIYKGDTGRADVRIVRENYDKAKFSLLQRTYQRGLGLKAGFAVTSQKAEVVFDVSTFDYWASQIVGNYYKVTSANPWYIAGEGGIPWGKSYRATQIKVGQYHKIESARLYNLGGTPVAKLSVFSEEIGEDGLLDNSTIIYFPYYQYTKEIITAQIEKNLYFITYTEPAKPSSLTATSI